MWSITEQKSTTDNAKSAHARVFCRGPRSPERSGINHPRLKPHLDPRSNKLRRKSSCTHIRTTYRKHEETSPYPNEHILNYSEMSHAIKKFSKQYKLLILCPKVRYLHPLSARYNITRSIDTPKSLPRFPSKGFIKFRLVVSLHREGGRLHLLERMAEKRSDDLPLDEFEITFFEHPWDEDPNGVEDVLHPMSDNVAAPERGLSECLDLSSALPAEKVEVEIGDTIFISQNDTDPASFDDILSAKSEDLECIETPLLMPTSLYTIDEENSIISECSIRHFRQVPFQKILSQRSPRAVPSKNKLIRASSSNLHKRRRFAVLKKVRQTLWRQKKSEESNQYTPFAGNVQHGMPFYSVRSILKDLETQSILSEKTGETSQTDKPHFKVKNTFLRFRKVREPTKSPDLFETAESSPTKQKNFSFFFSRKPSAVPTQVSEAKSETTASSSGWNPFHVLYAKRAWKKCSKSKKQPLEQCQMESIDRKTREPIRPDVKTLTRIIIVSNNNGTEYGEQSASLGSACAKQRSGIDVAEKTDFVESDFKAYSLGYDMIALLSDALIDLTNTIGGKIDRTCCTEKDGQEGQDGVSLILVGSSESVGELTETSHEICINKIETHEETKFGE